MKRTIPCLYGVESAEGTATASWWSLRPRDYMEKEWNMKSGLLLGTEKMNEPITQDGLERHRSWRLVVA